MTREEAKRRAELYSALAEGKTIQVKMSNYIWEDVNINLLNTIYDCNKYRIKPEPKCRPFKNQEECWNEMLKHRPFGWIRVIGNKRLRNIDSIGPNTYGIEINNSIMHFDETFNAYIFADGTPFGIKEE